MTIPRRLWGESASPLWLISVAAALALAGLGGSELWTMEGRWAAVCAHMVRSGDYLHPYLFGEPYYDKPLLSYWLMIAASWIVRRLDETALRLPSALAAVIAVGCVYRLGSLRLGRSTGLCAGFVLATSFMFVFWARVASADMLNLSGTIAAVAWYFEHRDRPTPGSQALLGAIVALTALTKGLIAVAVVGLAVLPDLLVEDRWRRFLRPSLAAALAIGLAVYLVPFLLSSLRGVPGYSESGLGMVVRENAVRYFEPFDHEEPVYVYLLHLPVYLFPWSLLLPFVGWSAWRRWPSMSSAERWPLIVCVLVLAFLTGSGSRRSYYVLPVLPFAALAIADWLQREARGGTIERVAGGAVVGMTLAMLGWFGIVSPLAFRLGGERVLARAVRERAVREAPWPDWQVVICGAPPAAGFYFRTSTEATVVPAEDADAVKPLVDRHPHSVILTKRRFVDRLRALFPNAAVLEETPRVPKLFRPAHGSDRDLIALVP